MPSSPDYLLCSGHTHADVPEEYLSRSCVARPGQIMNGHAHHQQGASTLWASQGDDAKTLFLNLVVVKVGDEAVNKAAQAMITKSLGGDQTDHPHLEGIAMAGLARMMTENKVASQLAQALPEKIEKKLLKKGIQAEVHKILHHDAFLVVQLDVKHVDFPKMMGHKVGFLESMLSTCDCGTHAHDMVDHHIAAKLIRELPPKLESELEEKGMQVKVVAKSTQEQPAYFQQVRNELGIDAAARKKYLCC